MEHIEDEQKKESKERERKRKAVEVMRKRVKEKRKVFVKWFCALHKNFPARTEKKVGKII